MQLLPSTKHRVLRNVEKRSLTETRWTCTLSFSAVMVTLETHQPYFKANLVALRSEVI